MVRFNIPKKTGFICVGVITQAHSLHGEVLIKPLIEDFTIIAKGTILLDAEDKELQIEKIRISNKGVIARFAEISNRNQAEDLRRTYLYLAKEQMPEIADDEIYYDDLKTYTIIDESFNELGSVKSVFDNGANTVMEVKTSEAKVLIPFTDDMVLEIIN